MLCRAEDYEFQHGAFHFLQKYRIDSVSPSPCIIAPLAFSEEQIPNLLPLLLHHPVIFTAFR